MEKEKDFIADSIVEMDRYLREQMGAKDGNRLWEATYISKQIKRRRQGEPFRVQDHIRAMVYSMLSAGIPWERVDGCIERETGRIIPVESIFWQCNPQKLLQDSPERLTDKIKEQNFAGIGSRKQMEALIEVNIPKLLRWDKEYGSIDQYYQKFIQEDASLKSLVIALSDSNSTDKLQQMGIALVSEYLRNVGYDIPKPDRHTRRILGSEILGLSEKKTAEPLEVFDIIGGLAEKMHKSPAEIDYILWSYCAKGYGEVCTAKEPGCGDCVIHRFCNRMKHG